MWDVETEHNLHWRSGRRKVVWDEFDWIMVMSDLECVYSPDLGSLIVTLDLLIGPAVMILKRISSFVSVSILILSLGWFWIGSVLNWKLADKVNVVEPTIFVLWKGCGFRSVSFVSYTTISFFLAVISACEGVWRNRRVYGVLGSGSRSSGMSALFVHIFLKEKKGLRGLGNMCSLVKGGWMVIKKVRS